MDGTYFFYFIIALATAYTISVRIIQSKIMDKNLMKEVQEKSKNINAMYAQAIKINDTRKMDEIAKMNSELMPKMNAMIMGQMKMMVIVIAVFFLFIFISDYFDPYPKDDFSINLTKNGDSENQTSNYSSYSGSFVLSNASDGFWYITAKAYSNETEIASNQTVFFVGPKTEQFIWLQNKNEIPITVHTDNNTYRNGDTVQLNIQAPKNAQRVVAILDNGTRLYIDLPFTIPLINLRRVYDSYGLFIFLAVITSLIISLVEKYLVVLVNKK